MNRKPDRRFLPLILAILLSLGIIPSSVSQNNDQYRTCNQRFRCGRLTRVGYPFWGGDRPVACGYPGLNLICRDNEDPLLNISSVLYRVLEIQPSSQTLRLARDDLLNNLCSAPPLNSSLNFTLFDFNPPSNDQNITIYYGCTVPDPRPQFLPTNYQLSCSLNGGGGGVSLFAAGASMIQQVNAVACDSSIFVPVNQTSARDLETPGVVSEGRLRESLAGGFTIRYLAENENCGECDGRDGLCGYNETATSFACLLPGGDGDGSGKLVIMGVSVGIATLIILSIIIYCITKQIRVHNQMQESNQNVDKFLLNHGSLAPKRYRYNEIKKITKSFAEKLGQGGYGIVYKGNLPDGRLVAVKVLTGTSDDAEEFINEVASISRTSHVNIVNLLGFNPQCSLEWEKLYEIAVGVARGLEYLHRGCNTRIVHFDIKPQNILLDEDFCPKISDFGLARLFKKKQSIMSTFGPRGTIGYIAPEVFFRRFGVVSHKSDVYSYGMMLLEMSEARKIVGNEAIQSSENYFPDKIYEYVLLKKESSGDLINEEKEDTKRKMLVVGLWCIQTAPSDRPSMTKVVEMLEGSQSIEVPPKPFLSSPTLSVPQFSSSFSHDLLHEL